ncbi:MAG: glycosyltransferase family A protein [Campylobacterota bacterium]|nr:glycosyltransferase family A protein [Campylobacterota bacterium]
MNKIKLFLKAYLGKEHALKLLVQTNIKLADICSKSIFQNSEYAMVIKNYLSKNMEKSEIFFLDKSKKDDKILFLLYNSIKKNKDIEDVQLLEKYFQNRSLYKIKKIDEDKNLYIDNITTKHNDKLSNCDEKVSVIITVYNCASLIYHSVKSILNQTYTNIEIIIINDGSTDGTLDVLNKLEVDYPNIKILSIKNSGTYVARNVGLTHSTGKYITFHDADDWAHPQRIEQHINQHKNNDCLASLSKLARIQPNGYFYSPIIYPVDRNCMLSLMFDRVVFEKLGYYRTGRFGNDSEYFERIKNFIKKDVLHIDKVLTICAQRPGSLTTTASTSNQTGKNQKRMHQMKRWRMWHKLHFEKHSIPYVKFNNKYE